MGKATIQNTLEKVSSKDSLFMDNETASHVKQVVADVESFWPAIVLVGTALLSWGLWWMRQMFASNKKLDAFINENRAQHDEIKECQNEIKNDVAYLRGKADE